MNRWRQGCFITLSGEAWPLSAIGSRDVRIVVLFTDAVLLAMRLDRPTGQNDIPA